MRLYKLIGLEIEALQAEYDETVKNIAIYQDILNNYDSMANVIMEDLDSIKREYSTKRRTVIENAEEVVYEEKKMTIEQLDEVLNKQQEMNESGKHVFIAELMTQKFNDEQNVQEALTGLIATIGENMSIRRFVRL